MQRPPIRSIGLTLLLCLACGAVGYWLPAGVASTTGYALCVAAAYAGARPYSFPIVAIAASVVCSRRM